MRNALLAALVAVCALGSTGCCGLGQLWPWPKAAADKPDQGPDPNDRGALGLHKSVAGRLREETAEDVAALTARARNGLQLLIRTNRDVYTMDEPIVLDVRLTNVSGKNRRENLKDQPRDIPIYFEPFAKSKGGKSGEWLFKFAVRDAKTERPVYRSPQFEVPEADRADYYHYMVLPPDAFVGRQFVFPPPSKMRGWLTPGTYAVQAIYEVSDDFPYVIRNRKFTPKQVELLGIKLAYARVWTGDLVSNRATFRVREKGRWWWPF